MDYITSDTSQQQLRTFRASLSIFTLNKKANAVLDSVDIDSLYPSKVPICWPDYLNYLDTTIVQGDTLLSEKFGLWGEFLNDKNLVIIEDYLYKITSDKTVIILDGDKNKLPTAEALTESDTANGIYIISPRSCSCSLTGKTWSEEQTVYNGNNLRSFSKLTFSNLTLVKYLSLNRARITPKWTIETNIRIQKKGLVGWHLERKTITFNRQVNIKHNFQTIPSNDPYIQLDGSWNQSTGWNQYEADFKYKTTHTYSPYTTFRSSEMPEGYCMAIRIFAQTANIYYPTIINEFFFFPYFEIVLDWDFIRYCSNFSWLK